MVPMIRIAWIAAWAMLSSADVGAAASGGLPAFEKPPGLGDREWDALRGAFRSAFGEEARLVGRRSVAGNDGESGDTFGYSVAVHGDRAVIGVPSDDFGALFAAGSAYTFVLQGSVWTLDSKLVAPDGESTDGFGSAVAIHGDTVVVGADGDAVGANARQGSAYVFARGATGWAQQAKLSADDGRASDRFGGSVAIDGNTIVVGARQHDLPLFGVDHGAAYVFERAGTSWSQRAKLSAPFAESDDWFGHSVAIDGDTILVGAILGGSGSDSNRGFAYVFTLGGTSWIPAGILTPGDTAAGDLFGSAVAISGDTALIGARGDDTGPIPDHGSAYVFVRNGTAWRQQAKLVPDDASPNSLFGDELALVGDTALIGSAAHDIGPNVDQGAAYVFTRSGTSWTQRARLTSSSARGGDRFGDAVSISGTALLVGAPTAGVGASDAQGLAVAFTRNGEAWTEVAQLTSGNGAGNQQFGRSVAVSGDAVAVGAPGANDSKGELRVFTREPQGWSLQAFLTHDDAADADSAFGCSVAMQGDTMLVGVCGDDVGASVNQGSLAVFRRNGDSWAFEARLVASDGMSFDRLGSAVAISGDTALAAAGGQAVYAFRRTGSIWSQEAKLVANGGTGGGGFGTSIAIDGDTSLVGAPSDSGVSAVSGAAYVFERTGSTWAQQARLVAQDGGFADWFGGAVALAGGVALVGAAGDDVGSNTNQGSVYLFTRAGGDWAQSAQLASPDGEADSGFGLVVALDGGSALIATRSRSQPNGPLRAAVAVYSRRDAGWTEVGQLVGRDLPADPAFTSMALDGNVAVVGNAEAGPPPYGNPNEGAAYVFRGLDVRFADGFDAATR